MPGIAGQRAEDKEVEGTLQEVEAGCHGRVIMVSSVDTMDHDTVAVDCQHQDGSLFLSACGGVDTFSADGMREGQRRDCLTYFVRRQLELESFRVGEQWIVSVAVTFTGSPAPSDDYDEYRSERVRGRLTAPRASGLAKSD